MTTFRQQLIDMHACPEAIKWVGRKGAATAWKQADRADWMLWLAPKILDRKTVVLAACDCAEAALQYVPEGEDRPKQAIETVRAWCNGRATKRQAHDDAAAAYAAAYAAYAAAYAAGAAADAVADAYAAYAAAYAAYAAVADAYTAYAAYVADAAVYAVYAAYAAYADAAYAAYAKAHQEMCRLIRQRISAEDIQKALEQ